jgi:hypothetical protein
MTVIDFDRQYWPTKKPVTIDMDTFFSNYPDEIDVFVAESVIANPPLMCIHFDGDEPIIEIFLWDVGDDVVTVRTSLAALIEDDATDYDKIRSTEQADDIKQRLTNLDKLQAAINNAKDRLNKQLSDFAGRP